MANLMVRVNTPDYDTWLNAFVSSENGLLEAGINQWTVYQDTWNSNIVMVHFIADDIDRAMAFFRSDEFKEINARSGATGRTFYLAQEQGAGASAGASVGASPAAAAPKPKTPRKTASASAKPAAKPAATKASTASKTATPAKTTRKTTKK
jgi:hypothetical protein